MTARPFHNGPGSLVSVGLIRQSLRGPKAREVKATKGGREKVWELGGEESGSEGQL